MTSGRQALSREQSLSLIRMAVSQNLFKQSYGERKPLVESLERKKASGEVPFLVALGSAMPNQIAMELASAAESSGCSGLVVSAFPEFSMLSLLERQWGFPTVLDCHVIDTAQLGVGDTVILSSKLFNTLNLDLGEFIDIAHSFGQEVVLEVGSKDEFKQSRKTEADAVLVKLQSDNQSETAESIMKAEITSRPVLAWCASVQEIKLASASGATGVVMSIQTDSDLLRSKECIGSLVARKPLA